jgi:hypothetical protein
VIWDLVFRAGYAVIRRLGPLVMAAIDANLPGFRGFVELPLRGRRTGKSRPAVLTLLVVDGRWYVGHPNGRADWTYNLEAETETEAEAGASEDGTPDRPRLATIELVRPGRHPVRVRPVLLPEGPERTAVIRATARQQPFPANLLYRAARRHILRVGVYYRLESAIS